MSNDNDRADEQGPTVRDVEAVMGVQTFTMDALALHDAEVEARVWREAARMEWEIFASNAEMAVMIFRAKAKEAEGRKDAEIQDR